MSHSATIEAPTQFVEANGVSYAYRRFGTGSSTPLLCLQHFTGTLDLWDPGVFDPLSKNRTIIFFENAGVGRSSGLTPDTVSGMAEHVIFFIDALKIKQVDMLGFSLGGFLAQYVALHRPELVRRIILSGTGPEGGEGTSMNRPELLKIFSNQQMSMPEKLKVLFFPDSEAAQSRASAYLKRLEARRTDKDTLATGQVAMNQLQAMAKWEAEKTSQFGALKKIAHPVLVTNGDHDIMIPTPNSFTLKNHITDATLIIYPDSGHGALYQYPSAFAGHVETFLT